MKILTACLGNICRSPLAHGILEMKAKQRSLDWEIDSAGTSGWHDGEPPDRRAIKTAKNNGIDISHQVSRKIKKSDLDYYDYILVMDSSNYQDVIGLCENEDQKEKVHMISNFLYPGRNVAVPDPYYDGNFAEVYDLLDKIGDSFIEHIQTNK